MIDRTWPVLVCNKQQQQSGGFTITLREPPEFDINRPYWSNRTQDGGPLSLNVTKEEYDSISIGDVLTISLTQQDSPDT